MIYSIYKHLHKNINFVINKLLQTGLGIVYNLIIDNPNPLLYRVIYILYRQCHISQKSEETLLNIKKGEGYGRIKTVFEGN